MPSAELVQHVRLALNRLADPSYLGVNPLSGLVPSSVAGDSAAARLRQVLVEAVESLRSDDQGGAGGDRAYRVLERRYLGGRSVVSVCRKLGISETEFYRQHQRGLTAVAATVAARIAGAPTAPESTDDGTRPAAAVRTNLPHRPTSFVGRQAELAECRRLLGTTPLLTLVGAPGIGKTRLALEVAAGTLDDYLDGVWLVDLGALSEATLVPAAFAAALGLRGGAGGPVAAQLEARLRGRQLLIVLDNCEHLVDACAVLLDRLLRACPEARVLATSREPLRVDGEVVYRLSTLPLPPDGSAVSVEQLERSAAGQLFLSRARAVDAGFVVAAEEADAVARICRRLDGVALAIELAAARVGALPIAEIEARLGDRFRLLRAPRRGAPARQQTLEALVDFSHDLLTDDERALLRRLSVFAGPFELAAAEAVCADTLVPAQEVVDLLARLVDKSLVLFDAAGGRYRMLETIRAYAAARLADAGEEEWLFARQRDRLQAVADAAAPHLWGDDARRFWIDRLERELDDIRSALRWCLENDAEGGLRLAVGLWRFWWEHGRRSEGLGWLTQALQRADPASPWRGRGLMAASFLARSGRRQAEAARALAEASLPLLEAAGDRAGVGLALHNLGMVIYMSGGDRHEAEALLERSLAASRAAGDTATVGMTLRDLGDLAAQRGDHRAAAARCEESLGVVRAIGDLSSAANTLAYLGELAAARGDVDEAEALFREGLAAAQASRNRFGERYNLMLRGHARQLAADLTAARASVEEALEMCRRIDDRRWSARALRYLGDVARGEGDPTTARAHYEESLALAREVDMPLELGSALTGLAEIARREGDLGSASRLLGEALRALERVGVPPLARCVAVAAAVQIDGGALAPGVRLAATAVTADSLLTSRLCPDERAARGKALAGARQAMGDAAFAAAWEEGTRSSLDDAVHAVRGGASAETEHRTPGS